MSNGEDEDTTTDADEAGGELATTESLTDRCEKAENALETAETEADLDDVEALIDAIASMSATLSGQGTYTIDNLS